MIIISKLKPIATSFVSKEDLQKVVFQYESSGPMSEEFFAYTREPLTDMKGDGRE